MADDFNIEAIKMNYQLTLWCDLPGKTLRGRFWAKLRTKDLAVMLKICRGVKFTPSLTWKLNPPDMAPGRNRIPKMKP